MEGLSRQQRRAAERRAAKPEPSEIQRTSYRHIGHKTKGMPYSRCKLLSATPGLPGRPSVLSLKHPSKAGIIKKVATPALLAVFYPSLPDLFAASMLGQR